MEKVFSALADTNRRKVVELLHSKDSTLLELSEQFPVSFQALSKHIRILEEAEIVNKRKEGKYRILSLNRESLKDVSNWITFYSQFWDMSFDRLAEVIDQKRNERGE